MIEGEIKEADGIVSLHIEATATIAGISGRVEFLIDTGAYATVLYPKDQAPFRGGIAAALQSAPIAVAEGVGGVATFRRISATLAFDDRETGATWEYRTEIYMAEPDGENDPAPGISVSARNGHSAPLDPPGHQPIPPRHPVRPQIRMTS